MSSRSSFTPTLITSIIVAVSLVAVTLIARVVLTNLVIFPTPMPLPSPTPTIPPPPTATPLSTPTPTNTPTPTSTPVQVSLPYVGPAGQLAYVQGGCLTVVEPDGSTTVVAEESVPHEFRPVDWSPAGHQLLYLTQRNARWEYHVWENPTGQILHLDQDVPGFPPEGDGFSGHAWSPDGRRLLFWAWQPDESGVWVVDVEARALSRVADGFKIVGATWVDTSTILYQEYQGTWNETLHLASITNPPDPLTNTLEGEWASGLHTLSPDRHYLAGIEWSDEPNRQLRVASLPGHPPLTLPAPPAAIVPLTNAPLWSPDGRWIAYGAQAIATPEEGAYTVLVDTTGLNPTRVIPDLFPQAWSPDSRMLAGPTCQSFDCGLAVTSVFTDRVTTIAADGQVHLWDLAWSPQGVHLAYSLTGPDADPGGLVLWDRSTGERRLLAPGGEAAPFTDLQWTPDGCHLYFAQRKGFVEGPASVEALWGIGPMWEHLWQVAPLASASPDQNPLPCPPSPLEGRRLISFYGTPAGPGLGILGRYDISTTLELLFEQIQAYRELDEAAGTEIEIVPGFHMITTVADDFAGGDADYSHRVEHDTVRPWIDGIRAVGGWSVLDVQPGHAELKTELDLIEPFLWESDVHLAVDPEFVMNAADQAPGLTLGQMSGQQVNYAQARLEQIARATGQRKVLVIHQFEDVMIGNKDEVLHYPLVDLIWDADGFGGMWSKIADYAQYSNETGFEYGGFKIFYQHDTPVMTPEQALELDPPAALIIYQ
jgi:hypothetical protein